MASLAALQSRVASLEALVEERDARIAALEQAVQTLTVGGAEAEPEWSAKKVREAFIEVRVRCWWLRGRAEVLAPAISHAAATVAHHAGGGRHPLPPPPPSPLRPPPPVLRGGARPYLLEVVAVRAA